MQMSKKDYELYLEEITELTELVRYDEEEHEYGVFITSNKEIYEYVRCTVECKNIAENIVLRDITSDDKKLSEYPQIEVCLSKSINWLCY